MSKEEGRREVITKPSLQNLMDSLWRQKEKESKDK